MEPKIPITEEMLQMYCDGLADPAQVEAVEAALAQHPELSAQLELQRRIEQSLQHTFQAAAPEIDQIVASLTAATPSTEGFLEAATEPLRWNKRRTAILAAVAAGLFWMFIAGYLWWNVEPEPFFEKTPLVALYEQAVTRGFKPYYHCEDPERFAATFSKRQNIPLQLADLPPDRRMLGLSYPGGLSRDTTAMLSIVEEKPVMVFVDRLAVDDPAAVATDTEQLHVFREVRDGLVFYEVSPFSEPKMIDFLAVPESDR